MSQESLTKQRPAEYTHGKATLRSFKDHVMWLYLRPYVVTSWCGASRTIWDCWKQLVISISPSAAAPATLPRGIADMKMNENRGTFWNKRKDCFVFHLSSITVRLILLQHNRFFVTRRPSCCAVCRPMPHCPGPALQHVRPRQDGFDVVSGESKSISHHIWRCR